MVLWLHPGKFRRFDPTSNHSTADFRVKASSRRSSASSSLAGKFESQAEAKVACFSYIEGFYNPVRLLSAIGYQSPIHYEQQITQELAVTT
jgi:transposase InsO family protein